MDKLGEESRMLENVNVWNLPERLGLQADTIRVQQLNRMRLRSGGHNRGAAAEWCEADGGQLSVEVDAIRGAEVRFCQTSARSESCQSAEYIFREQIIKRRKAGCGTGIR